MDMSRMSIGCWATCVAQTRRRAGAPVGAERERLAQPVPDGALDAAAHARAKPGAADALLSTRLPVRLQVHVPNQRGAGLPALHCALRLCLRLRLRRHRLLSCLVARASAGRRFESGCRRRARRRLPLPGHVMEREAARAARLHFPARLDADSASASCRRRHCHQGDSQLHCDTVSISTRWRCGCLRLRDCETCRSGNTRSARGAIASAARRHTREFRTAAAAARSTLLLLLLLLSLHIEWSFASGGGVGWR